MEGWNRKILKHSFLVLKLLVLRSRVLIKTPLIGIPYQLFDRIGYHGPDFKLTGHSGSLAHILESTREVNERISGYRTERIKSKPFYRGIDVCHSDCPTVITKRDS